MGNAATTDNATPGFRRTATALAIAAMMAAGGTAEAFEIDTGNADISMRWDNTVRYNAGVRMQKQNPQILGNPNFDDGDRNFGNGSLVTSRFDVLSEFDFIYKKSYGFRASYAAWWDPAYNSLDDQSTAIANTLVNGLPVAGALSPYTKRYSKGVSGEWLDASGCHLRCRMLAIVKAGQHTVFWGTVCCDRAAPVCPVQNSLAPVQGVEAAPAAW
jgi:hypothetical protein